MIIDAHQLREFILEQGWSSYGIVPIETVKNALKMHEAIFDRWVRHGYQADMHYLERMKQDRFHPENKLPGIKSVIVLQAWYGSEFHSKAIDNQSGFVARYAYGRDYHKVLKKKLLVLSKWLQEKDSSVQTTHSVDSGPTVDRVLAHEAGLGFFGKNCNIIDPSKGSYFFIASLSITVKLPATEKKRMPNCGNCNRCFTACPTKAIVAPGVIDARRCISYLTIENKGGIPYELRSAIGNRLFGCDICQEVCPFNEGRAGKQEVRMEALKSDQGVGRQFDLIDIFTIENDDQFKKRFAGTPLMRAKRVGLLRNACVVAGNTGDKSLVPWLQAFLKRETDDMLKEHASWAIHQIQSH